jgi:hypothetical protein
LPEKSNTDFPLVYAVRAEEGMSAELEMRRLLRAGFKRTRKLL